MVAPKLTDLPKTEGDTPEKGSQGKSAGKQWAENHGYQRPEQEQNPSTQGPATDAEQAGTTGWQSN